MVLNHRIIRESDECLSLPWSGRIRRPAGSARTVDEGGVRTLRDLRVPRLDGAKQRKDSPAVLLQKCKSEDHTQVLKAALYLSHVYGITFTGAFRFLC